MSDQAESGTGWRNKTMIGRPQLPYETIGKATVVVATTALLLAVTFILFIINLFVWYRGLDRLTNLLWWGYGDEGTGTPPGWRLQLSFYVQAIKNFDLSMVDDFRENAHKLESDNEQSDHDVQTGKERGSDD